MNLSKNNRLGSDRKQKKQGAVAILLIGMVLLTTNLPTGWAAPPVLASETDAPHYRITEIDLPAGAKSATATALAANGAVAGVADVVERPPIRGLGPAAPGVRRGGANSYSRFDRDAPYTNRDNIDVLALVYLLLNWQQVRDFYRRPIDDDETGPRGPSGAGKRVRMVARQPFVTKGGQTSHIVTDKDTQVGVAVVTGINAQGVLVGLIPSSLDADRSRAWVWNPTGGKNERGRGWDVGTLGGPASAAWGINDTGRVVGDAQMDGGIVRAFVALLPAAEERFRLLDLGTLGGSQSHARAVNARGRAVGGAETSAYENQACVWETGTDATLFLAHATPLPVPMGTLSSEAVAVASDGSAAGRIEVSKGVYAACVWPQGSDILVIGTLTGGAKSEATGAAFVNGGLTVVGISDISPDMNPALTSPTKKGELPSAPDSPRRPFLWRAGKLWDLNALVSADSGWTLLGASAINDRGEIAGWGRKGKQILPCVLRLE